MPTPVLIILFDIPVFFKISSEKSLTAPRPPNKATLAELANPAPAKAIGKDAI